MNTTTRRFLRTLLQLIAGGALTALVDQLATDVPASLAPYLVIGFTLLVTLAQNTLEDFGLDDRAEHPVASRLVAPVTRQAN